MDADTIPLHKRYTELKKKAKWAEQAGDREAALRHYTEMLDVLEELSDRRRDSTYPDEIKDWVARRRTQLDPDQLEDRSNGDRSTDQGPSADSDSASTSSTGDEDREGNSSAGSGKSDGAFHVTEPEYTFSDVAGMQDEKEELNLKVLEAIDSPEQYQRLGLSPPNGILFYGPPGTGKSLLSEALGGEADASYIELDASELRNKYVGESEKNIRRMFETAEEQSPCIVFIDEIDAVATNRGEASDSPGKADMVNVFLRQLHESPDDVIVVGATNYRDRVDKAFFRQGRFGTQLKIGLPDSEQRRAVLEYELEDRATQGRIDIERLVASTAQYSCADMVQIVEEAGFQALQDNEDAIRQKHLERGYRKVDPTGNPDQ